MIEACKNVVLRKKTYLLKLNVCEANIYYVIYVMNTFIISLFNRMG